MKRIMLSALVPAALLLLAAAVRAETPLGMWETGESHIVAGANQGDFTQCSTSATS